MPRVIAQSAQVFWQIYESKFKAGLTVVDTYHGSERVDRTHFTTKQSAEQWIEQEKLKIDGPPALSSGVLARYAALSEPSVLTAEKLTESIQAIALAMGALPITPTLEKEEVEEVKHTTLSATEDCWALVAAILPHSERLLLWGPPGVGKTHLATMSVDRNEFYSITLTEETPAAELRGHFIMKGGDFIWHHGPAIKAWLEGKLLIINEIHKASNDAFSFLLALLDDKNIAALTLPNGDTVRPHSDFKVIATSNAEPGSLPEALQSRFAVAIEITRPADGAIASLPEDLREAAKNSAVIDDCSRRVGIRAWKAFAHLRQFVGPEVAAKAVFAERSEDILNSLLIATR